jgi:hypothetical protein
MELKILVGWHNLYSDSEFFLQVVIFAAAMWKNKQIGKFARTDAGR